MIVCLSQYKVALNRSRMVGMVKAGIKVLVKMLVLVMLLVLVLAPWIAESELREHSRTPSQLLGSGVHCVEHHRPEKIVAHTPSLNRGVLLHENLEQKSTREWGHMVHSEELSPILQKST